jgi:hypothetical protein
MEPAASRKGAATTMESAASYKAAATCKAAAAAMESAASYKAAAAASPAVAAPSPSLSRRHRDDRRENDDACHQQALE